MTTTRHERQIWNEKTKQFVRRTFELTINAEAIATDLCNKAYKSKRKTATAFGGAVVLKEIKT